MTFARRWIVPGLIMLGCAALVGHFNLGGQDGLMIGWVGGAIAVLQWPGRDAL